MADRYKLGSLVIGILMAGFLVRMKRTYLLVPMAAIQLACFQAFAGYLNTLCCATVRGQLL